MHEREKYKSNLKYTVKSIKVKQKLSITTKIKMFWEKIKYIMYYTE